MKELIIIGGGPIGIACALAAKKKGLDYVIIEKGCIVNSLYHYPSNMQFFSSSDKLEIDNIPFISTQARPYKEEALEYYRRIVTNNELNINLFEKVKKLNKGEDGIFHIQTSKATYQSQYVIVATGFYDIPNDMNVPGEDLPHVSHYYDNPHLYAMQRTAIVGASNSAIDAALEIYRKGGQAILLVRDEEISHRVKYWVRPDVLNRIAEGSIEVHYQTNVKEIQEGQIIVETKGEEKTIPVDFVLALTGYQPNFEFLESMGVALSEDALKLPQYNEETMESNVDNLYLAGVVCGGKNTHLWFIENSIIHADMIMEDIMNKKG